MNYETYLEHLEDLSLEIQDLKKEIEEQKEKYNKLLDDYSDLNISYLKERVANTKAKKYIEENKTISEFDIKELIELLRLGE